MHSEIVSKKWNKNYNILLFGQGTYLNKGCEAIILTTAGNMKRANSNNKVTVCTYDIDGDKKKYNDIIDKYISHRRANDLAEDEKVLIDNHSNVELYLQKNAINEIDNSDICISVGGDNYCYNNNNRWYAIDDAVKDKNKKLILWGASINEDAVDESFLKDIRRFDIVYVRESLTYELLSRFVDNKKLVLQPDTAFSLDPNKIKLPKQFEENLGIVGLNISPLIFNYKGDNAVDIIASVIGLIEHILKTYPYKIALIPHVYIAGSSDLNTLREIKKAYADNERVFVLDDKIYDCRELKYIISKCKFIVAARTHASIAGYSMQIPTLVLGYSIKSKGIAKDIFGDYENYVLPIEELSEKKLIEKFEFLVKNETKIKDILSQKMPSYLEKSKKLFETVIRRMEENEKGDITKKEKCSGCSACASACPEKAIEMIQDDEGFSYPFIDIDKCTNCGICRIVCPNNKKYVHKYDGLKSYACKSLDEGERAKSSSGGIFSLLASSVLNDGGSVFGAIYDNYDVKHIGIENESGLEKLRGSKYAESTIGNSYIEVKRKLSDGKKILFSGVPCQIEGLKSFLGKDYPNLYCVSVVCHGVPSKKVFSQYLKEMEKKYDDKIVRVNFRNKEKGWKDFQIEYVFGNKTIKRKIWEDAFMIGFLKNYYLRQSCYDCDYRLNKKNTSDIILGDFWGIQDELEMFDDNKGVSAVIVNSKKGQELFNRIQDKIKNKEVLVDQIGVHNLCLKDSVPLNSERFEFFDLFNRAGLIFTIEYLEKNKEAESLKNKLQQSQEELFQAQEKIQQNQLDLNRLESMTIQNPLRERASSDIMNSRKWKLMMGISAAFGFVFPHGSLRRKFLRMSYKLVERLFKRK
jgi:polysaccharide pyruvyl transferase WcaK-like protein/coenzyme F420-reducing hydrogenase beta subunit